MAPMKRERGLLNLVAFLRRHNITVTELARALDCHRFSITSAIRRGSMDAELRSDMEFLFEIEGYKIPRNLWVNSEGVNIAKPTRQLRRLSDHRIISVPAHHPLTRERNLAARYISPHAPNASHARKEEQVQPLSLTARRRFGFTHDPFRTEMRTVADVLMTPEHKACLEEMKRAAQRQDFIAIMGASGCGKNTVLECFEESLPSNIHIIKAHTLDKKQLTGANLYEAIILDIAGETKEKASVPAQRERRARKVIQLLEALERDDRTACLILDEAHDLSKECLRALKRLHELDRTFKRLLSIILIGHLELRRNLDDPTLLEVGHRCARFEFRGLNGRTLEYCRHKIEAAGVKLENVIDPAAIKYLEQQCIRTIGNGRNNKYGPYPMQLNTALTNAFNHADLEGYKRVTLETVEAILQRKEDR